MTRPRRSRSDSVQSPLETYLREINETPLLSSEEEKRLAYRIEEGEPYVLGELDIHQIDRMIEKLQGLKRELDDGRKDAAVSPTSAHR